MCDDQIGIYDCFAQKDFLKEKLGARWQAKNKVWLVSANEDNLKVLKKLGATISQDVYDVLEPKEKARAIIESIKNKVYTPTFDYNSLFVKEFRGQPFSLMQHQLLGASFADTLYEHGYTGCMLSMQMGTGKTLTAMAMLGRQHKLGNCNKLLVVCPKVAMEVWRNEFDNFADFGYSIVCLKGTPKKRLDLMNWIDENGHGLQVVVINYEYVYAFQDILDKWKPDFILCDESHKIKGVSTQQTKAVTKIGQKCKFRLCLTGTPLTANIIDFFSQYKFMDSSIFGLSITCFKMEYIITGMFGEYLRPNPMSFGKFKDKVNSIAFRVTKDECLQLPPAVDITIPVELTCMRHYKELERDFITWLDNNTNISVSNALTQTLSLRQMTGGFYYEYDTDEVSGKKINRRTVFIDDSKVSACMELIENIINSGEKVVVFAEFQAEIEKIQEACNKAGYKCGTYYGATSDTNRDKLIDGFVNGDIQVFIGQIESAGISITLTVSKYMIFYSTGYKYGVYDQARARIHRKGQKNECTYYHLIASNTIDKKIMKALSNKEQLSQSIIDDYRNKNEEN